jgi:hypothetical protein
MAKKNRMPKKIAGIKIPKVLRKNSLIKGLISSPTGRQVIADALLAAAGAAAAVLATSKSGGAAKTGTAIAHKTEDGAKIAKRALKSAASALTDSLSSAAKSAFGNDDRQHRHNRPH